MLAVYSSLTDSRRLILCTLICLNPSTCDKKHEATMHWLASLQSWKKKVRRHKNLCNRQRWCVVWIRQSWDDSGQYRPFLNNVKRERKRNFFAGRKFCHFLCVRSKNFLDSANSVAVAMSQTHWRHSPTANVTPRPRPCLRTSPPTNGTTNVVFSILITFLSRQSLSRCEERKHTPN